MTKFRKKPVVIEAVQWFKLGLKCPECGRVTEQPADDNDFPLGQACDLSDDSTCEACQ